MKNQSEKHTAAKRPTSKESLAKGGEVSHLDAALTDITSTVADRVKRWRTPLGAVLVIAFGGWVAYSIATSLAESRADSLSERVYKLLEGPSPKKDDYAPDKGDVEKLLADVQGQPIERFAVKGIAERFLTRAESSLAKNKESEKSKKEKEAGEPGKEGAAGSSTTPPATVPAAEIEADRDFALKIAGDAAQRFPNDTDIQEWAKGMKEKIRQERDTSWLPAGWKYAPPPPKPLEAVPPAGEARAAPGPALVPPAAPAPAAGAEAAPAAPQKAETQPSPGAK